MKKIVIIAVILLASIGIARADDMLLRIVNVNDDRVEAYPLTVSENSFIFNLNLTPNSAIFTADGKELDPNELKNMFQSLHHGASLYVYFEANKNDSYQDLQLLKINNRRTVMFTPRFMVVSTELLVSLNSSLDQ